MKFKLALFSFLLCALCACHHVSDNPKDGADDLFKQLTKLSQSGDVDKAHDVMLEYWQKYSDKDSETFILRLRENLMTNDDVVNFIAEPDFKTYPIFGTYFKELHKVAKKEAMQNLSDIADSNDKSAYNSSAASKGLLLGSLLANYYDENNMAGANEILETTYYNVRNESFMYRIEFAAALEAFIKESGEPGQKAFEMISQSNSDIATDFKLMLLESSLVYD